MIEFREEGTTESTARYIDEGFMQHALEQVGVDGRKEQRAFLAYEQGLQVGIVIVENFWGALHFKYVFISSSHRRMGIGRQLMQRALEFGKERLYPFAFVETMSFQGLPFYQKLGFHLDFTRSGFSEGVLLHHLSCSL